MSRTIILAIIIFVVFVAKLKCSDVDELELPFDPEEFPLTPVFTLSPFPCYDRNMDWCEKTGDERILGWLDSILEESKTIHSSAVK